MKRPLETLVRLGRWRLEEARRGHAELERHLGDLEAERALLLGRLAEERGNRKQLGIEIDVGERYQRVGVA